MRSRIIILLWILLLALSSAGQIARLPVKYDVVKAENGVIIGWHLKVEDPAAEQVGVYDEAGKLLVHLNPLRLVPGARWSSIHDVSALPGQLIAVAAVYRKADNSIPAASLLCFDFWGNLAWALALAPSREAWRLTVDSDANVWTLTTGAGGLKPSEAPMVVGYRPSGVPFREMFKRSEFPDHAYEIQENPAVGAPGFGHTADAIWFWLAGSTDQVTFRADGSSVQRLTTGLPGQSKHELPVKVVLANAGRLVAEIQVRENATSAPQLRFVLRFPATGLWSTFSPPCSGCRLIGISSGRALFRVAAEGGSDIYAASLPE